MVAVKLFQISMMILNVLSEYYAVSFITGNGTNHKHQLFLNRLTQSQNYNYLIGRISQYGGGSKLYWQYNPPTGWRKIIPTSMQFHPEPVDDSTACYWFMLYS